MLKFKDANGKLKKMAKRLGVKLKTFTLPAGYTCGGAKDCLAYADRKTGKVRDGKETKFRCFMAVFGDNGSFRGAQLPEFVVFARNGLLSPNLGADRGVTATDWRYIDA